MESKFQICLASTYLRIPVHKSPSHHCFSLIESDASGFGLRSRLPTICPQPVNRILAARRFHPMWATALQGFVNSWIDG
jgi:hypothetical protein